MKRLILKTGSLGRIKPSRRLKPRIKVPRMSAIEEAGPGRGPKLRTVALVAILVLALGGAAVFLPASPVYAPAQELLQSLLPPDATKNAASVEHFSRAAGAVRMAETAKAQSESRAVTAVTDGAANGAVNGAVSGAMTPGDAATGATMAGMPATLAPEEIPLVPGMTADTTAALPDSTTEGRRMLDRGVEMVYSAGGRDPFRSLLLEEPDYGLLNLVDTRLVGVAWTDKRMLAMLEDRQGRTWTLRPGDRVQYGRLVSVTQKAAVFDVSIYGKPERRVLELIPREKESKP